MAGGLWNKLKGTLGFNSPGEGTPLLTRWNDTLPNSVLAKYFSALASTSKVVRHIEHGDTPSVLLDLQIQTMRQAWQQRRNRYNPQADAQLFANLGGWRVDQMMRFGEVCAALEPINHDWGFYGTKKSPDWLRHTVSKWLAHDHRPGRRLAEQPVETLRELAQHGGLGMAEVIDIVFCRDAASYGQNSSVTRFSGVHTLLADEQGAVNTAFADAGADVRAALVGAIGRFGLHGVYLPLLLDAATGSAKKVRTAARASLTGADKAALAALIEERFAKAAPAKRAELVEVAATALGNAASELLTRLRADETNARVLSAFDMTAGATAPMEKKTINPFAAAALADGPAGYAAVDGTRVELPPIEPLPAPTKLDRGALKLLEPALDEFNRKIAEGKKQAAASRWHWSKPFSVLGQFELERLAKLAEGTGAVSGNESAVNWLRFHMFRHPAVDQFLDDPRVSLRHLVRIGVACANRGFHSLFSDWSGPVGGAIRRRVAAGADMRQVTQLWSENGGHDFVAEHLKSRWYYALPDAGVEIWPAFLHHLPKIDEALGLSPQSGSEAMRPQAAFDLLEQMPKLPERYRSRMLLLANDTSMHIRNRARALLQGTPGLGEAISLQLQDGRQTVRAQAADWLAKRGEREQAPALRAALKTDKSDVARAAMISALGRGYAGNWPVLMSIHRTGSRSSAGSSPSPGNCCGRCPRSSPRWMIWSRARVRRSLPHCSPTCASR